MRSDSSIHASAAASSPRKDTIVDLRRNLVVLRIDTVRVHMPDDLSRAVAGIMCDVGQRTIGIWLLRIEFDRPLCGADGLVVTMQASQDVGARHVHGRICRVELQHAIHLHQRAGDVPDTQELRIQHAHGDIVRGYFHGALIQLPGVITFATYGSEPRTKPQQGAITRVERLDAV